MAIRWIVGRVEYDHIIGLLGHGLRINLTRFPDGWEVVVFGSNTIPQHFATEYTAKQEGCALARKILTECLVSLTEPWEEPPPRSTVVPER